MLRSLTPLLFAALALVAPLHALPPVPAETKTGDFAIGCQAYSFRLFSVFEAIEKTAAAGGKVIEFYPGQTLSKEEPTIKWGHEAPVEARAKVKAKLKEHGITPMAYGVVKIPNDEAKARPIFEFAKDMGLRVINTESTESIDLIEKLVKEFDICVGYHNHPVRIENPDYKVWDPNYILSLVKDRDQRIGACADTGHWQRSGLKPVDCLKILKGRIVSSHLKDLTALDRKAHDLPYGQGVGDVAGVLKEYKAQGFAGPISVEYEYKWENSSDDIKACIDFVRAQAGK